MFSFFLAIAVASNPPRSHDFGKIADEIISTKRIPSFSSYPHVGTARSRIARALKEKVDLDHPQNTEIKKIYDEIRGGPGSLVGSLRELESDVHEVNNVIYGGADQFSTIAAAVPLLPSQTIVGTSSELHPADQEELRLMFVLQKDVKQLMTDVDLLKQKQLQAAGVQSVQAAAESVVQIAPMLSKLNELEEKMIRFGANIAAIDGRSVPTDDRMQQDQKIRQLEANFSEIVDSFASLGIKTEDEFSVLRSMGRGVESLRDRIQSLERMAAGVNSRVFPVSN